MTTAPPKRRKSAQVKVNAMSYAKMIHALYCAPKTKQQLADITGLHVWTCRNHVDSLHKEGVIHIAYWIKDSMGRDATAVYTWGFGVDAKRFAKTPAQKARERRQRKREEEIAARKAIISATSTRTRSADD